MKRRKFVSLAAGGALFAIAGNPAFGETGNAADLVSTPGKRLDYTRRLLKKLCNDIGPRPSGSKGFAKGAEIIRKEMKLSLPQVHFDPYKFEKWELNEEAEFIVGGQRIEAIPAAGGIGTSLEGIHGVLQKSKNGFSLIDPLTKDIKANITIGSFGKGTTRSALRRDQAPLPSFSIGKQDVPLLENAERDKVPAWTKFVVRYTTDADGFNIVGRLPGKQKEEILILAHADTVYNTPGGNDNTASVIVMLMLAHAAAARANNHSITFVATGNEEFGMLGANNYAEKCKQAGTFENFKYVINFDSLTYGPNLWISSKQEDVKDILRSIHKDLQIKSTPIFDSSDGFVMDSEPFRHDGAKGLHANSRGYDEKTLPVYHRPDDTADAVPLDCVESSFLVFDEFIKRIDKLGKY